MAQNLDLIFAGSGEFGLPSLKALIAAGHRIVQVISQPDRPAGRGKTLTPTPISAFAVEQGLPLLRTENINRESTVPPADLMVVIAFGQKIAPHVVDAPRLGSINLHASRLPKYRGAAPINWAIINGETTTGNSVIRLADRMDAGAVLGMSELAIGETETAGELHDRLSQDGAELLPVVVNALADQSAVEAAQDESAVTLAGKLSRDLATLDWTQPAERVARLINGLSPWPGCRVSLRDAAGAEVGRLRLLRARLCDECEDRWHPGEVTTTGAVQAGDRCVQLLDVQPDGKRPMSIADFRRGHVSCAGLRLDVAK